MTDDEAAALMQEYIDDGDKERAHSYADEFLCKLLEDKYPKTIATFRSNNFWYA